VPITKGAKKGVNDTPKMIPDSGFPRNGKKVRERVDCMGGKRGDRGGTAQTTGNGARGTDRRKKPD